ARLDIQTLTLRGRADLVDDDRAFEAGVLGELPNRLLERPDDDRGTGPLVTFELVGLDRVDRIQQRDASARDDALLEGSPSGLQRVLDAVLLLLHLGLGRGTDLDDRNAA